MDEVNNNQKFVAIPKLLTPGIGISDEPCLFYRRHAFNVLAKFVDNMIVGNHIGMVDGLPGTGNSSAMWWALQQPKHKDKTIAWLHLGRSGGVEADAVKPKGGEFASQAGTARQSVRDIAADVLVVDGVNHEKLLPLDESMDVWLRQQRGRIGFLTTSNKIIRLHEPELRILVAQQKKGVVVTQFYCTHHSWTMDEYKDSDPGCSKKTAPSFEKNETFKRMVLKADHQATVARSGLMMTEKILLRA